MAKIAVIGLVGESVFMEVERFHEGGETVHARSLYREYGGKGFNQALAAARWGARVAFLGAVGAGEARRVAGAVGAEEGRLALHLKEKAGAGAYAAILTDRTGANRVTVCPGAVLEPNDVDAFSTEIVSADVLVLGHEVPEAVNERALDYAQANGVKVVCNPAPVRPLSAKMREGVTLFTPNEFEALPLQTLENVVVTLGADGCLVRSRGRHLSGVKVKAVVDTTGAGDVFNGVLAAMLADGADLEAACAAANRAAAFSVTRRHVLPSIPRQADLGQFESERKERS